MEFGLPRPSIQPKSSASSEVPLVRAQKSSSRARIPTYVWPTLFTALGGWLWGYDTGSIGPIIVMPQFEKQFGSISPKVQGLLVSSIIATAALASIGSGALSDRISRTYTISLGAFVFSVGSAIACSANALPQLFIGRCITGFGEGLYISSVAVYSAEISPAATRGRAMATVPLLNTLGVAAGYFTCYGTVNYSDSISWRLPLGLQAVVAIVLAVGTPFFPHSPDWLLSVASRQTLKQQATELWAKDVRFRTLFGLFLMGMGQACGIDAVLYYAPVLFQQAGLSTTSASFLASGVSGILMVVLTAASQVFQDNVRHFDCFTPWARRTQMIGGGSVIAGCMLVMGGLYASNAAQTRAGQRTLIALIYIFIAAFISSGHEIQPKRTRASATSLAQCFSWLMIFFQGGNWVIAFSTPVFLTHSSSGPYFLFGACALLTVLVCVVFQPETKGVSLDVLDQGFADTKLQSAVKRYFGSKGHTEG
ncbi:general substrate transporter [Mycena leptocephala]|nr:general substrate transporter [Mycena leptocephala]